MGAGVIKYPHAIIIGFVVSTFLAYNGVGATIKFDIFGAAWLNFVNSAERDPASRLSGFRAVRHSGDRRFAGAYRPFGVGPPITFGFPPSLSILVCFGDFRFRLGRNCSTLQVGTLKILISAHKEPWWYPLAIAGRFEYGC